MSRQQRAIDVLTDKPRERPMEVLCLGLSRTATMSMHEALTKLGHKTYHFKEIGQTDIPNEPAHIDAWREAFLAKMYGNGKPYGKEEFDRLLRRYSAVTDAPCVCFSDELLAAYPDAKVILTLRDKQKWLTSMETAYYRILESRDWKWFRALSALDLDFLWPYNDLLRMPLRYWTGDDWQNRDKLLKTFDDHCDRIRAVVAKDNLLEWTPADGWDPLCNFLGKSVPIEPFPNINKGGDVAELHRGMAYVRAASLIWGWLRLPLTVLGAGAFALVTTWWSLYRHHR